eukprot:GILI01026749.1.p1 GENE.GILI01026749.1~~GILI01026749.1.p1  ORF type:complete len:244 (+),score=36.24 GILI01026749.1:104-835(+)
MKKHPGSFPQAASIPVLYSVVKRCKEAMPSMQSNACYPYPQYGPNGASVGSYQPNSSNPSNSHRESTMLLFNEKAFVVNDPFNKSTFHCLVLPWDTKLKSLNDLNDSHLPLLDEMAALGNNYMSFLREQHMGSSSKKLRMILGFHAIPSLPMLHMHCISLDLESEKLKKKQHYNSFATYYFLPFEAVRADLVKNKTVTINQNVDALNELADGPMKCLWCGQALANMPDMKRHVPACPKNMSRE